jgi:hypothetical protein
MNRHLGIFSSLGTTLTTDMFAIGMLIGSNYLSYLVCMILAWFYLIFVCSLLPEISPDRRAFGYAGLAFAGLYSMQNGCVYFIQLTTVTYRSASPEIMEVISYETLGSMMFNLDLLGYGLMALSTFFIGIALVACTRTDRWLKTLLMIHGIFALSCILLPLLNVFSADSQGGSLAGTIALLFWCLYATPLWVLGFIHFKKRIS